MLRSLLLSISLLLLAAAPAAAGDNPYQPAGVSVWAPDDWSTKGAAADDGAMLVSSSPAEDAGFIVMAFDAKDLEKATKALDGLLATIVTDAKVGKMKKTSINGMKAVAARGTAVAEGKDVAIAVLLIQPPVKGKAVLFVGLVETAKKDAYEGMLEKVLAGIKPL